MVAASVVLIVLIAGVDLFFKEWIESSFRSDESITCCKEKITIRKVHNKGMMMNWMQQHSGAVRTGSFVALVLVFIYQMSLFRKAGCNKEKIGMALIAGGAVSNTFDRIRRGYVVDYIGFNCKKEKISNITYNLGDFAIFSGAVLVLIENIFKKK